jgi:hypothetical protein
MTCALGRTANDVHARRLEQISGVASVAVVGAPEDEIRIEVDPDKMRALGLSTERRRHRGAERQCQWRRRHDPSRTVPLLGAHADRVPRLDEISETPVGPVSANIRCATSRR